MNSARSLLQREFAWMGSGERIYLNAASNGALPARTVAAAYEILSLRSEPWRLSDERSFSILRDARESCARLIGATADEIGLMSHTSTGINFAARALPMAAGDVVVIPDGEFPANVYPWLALERARGVRVHRVPLVNGLPDEDGLLRALDEVPNVRVVSVSWVSFNTGACLDLARIGAACRARGIAFVVDAIQGVGARTLDVGKCHIDVLACGAQKWLLSPWGTAFTYVRAELVQALDPPVVGWMAVRGSDDFTRLLQYDLTYRDNARRFESVVVPIQDFAGLQASLSLFFEVGLDAVAKHVGMLATRIVDWARDRTDVQLITPANAARRAGIVAFAPKDVTAASARLTERGVSHSVREGAIRFAPHIYNTESDIDQALAAIAA